MTGFVAKGAVLALASVGITRGWLNRRYDRMPLADREAFWARYAKIFRRAHPPVQPGDWRVSFMGRDLRVPLRSSSMWLDWDYAISIVAHDMEVKQLYRDILASAERPDLFVDIGSNYGAHALLMASQGVDVLAFEPLTACVDYARHMARANGVQYGLENVALSDGHGTISLTYPPTETWLATATQAVAPRAELVTDTVPVAMLDDYLDRLRGRRVLMKIDVEGLEEQVLRGAAAVLAEVRPTIVFESHRDATRPGLFDALAAHGYAVAPLDPSGVPARPIAREAYLASEATNFVARPG